MQHQLLLLLDSQPLGLLLPAAHWSSLAHLLRGQPLLLAPSSSPCGLCRANDQFRRVGSARHSSHADAPAQSLCELHKNIQTGCEPSSAPNFGGLPVPPRSGSCELHEGLLQPPHSTETFQLWGVQSESSRRSGPFRNSLANYTRSFEVVTLFFSIKLNILN